VAPQAGAACSAAAFHSMQRVQKVLGYSKQRSAMFSAGSEQPHDPSPPVGGTGCSMQVACGVLKLLVCSR
jgi:hypothetical protein